MDKILLCGDIFMAQNGVEQQHQCWDTCDELIINIRSSKTDQLNNGAMLNYYASDDVLCPVRYLLKHCRR